MEKPRNRFEAFETLMDQAGVPAVMGGDKPPAIAGGRREKREQAHAAATEQLPTVYEQSGELLTSIDAALGVTALMSLSFR